MAGKKFETLDGLRGIAALAVVLYHLSGPLHLAARAGYLAVDLFFLMSGFVIAAAYERRLLAGWSIGAFLIVRLKRLWPLYAMGVASGVACFLLIRFLRPEASFSFPNMSIAQAALMSLLFVPQLAAYGGPAFPFNSASWSLSVELVGNLGYAALIHSLRTRMLTIVIAIGFAGLTAIAIKADGLNVGVSAGNILGGYVRFLFSFPLGVLLYRLHAAGKLPVFSLPPLLPLALAAIALIGFVPQTALWDLLIVALLFPVILIGSISTAVPHRMVKIFAWAGAVSYPLYILHPPLVELVSVLVQGRAYLVASFGCVFAIVLFAMMAERYFDRPLRRWLKRATIGPIERVAN